jgi:hypothetical protein
MLAHRVHRGRAPATHRAEETAADMRAPAEASRGEGMATRGAWTRGGRAEATEGVTAGDIAAAAGRAGETRGARGRTTAGRAGGTIGEMGVGTLITTGGGGEATGGTGTRPFVHIPLAGKWAACVDRTKAAGWRCGAGYVRRPPQDAFFSIPALYKQQSSGSHANKVDKNQTNFLTKQSKASKHKLHNWDVVPLVSNLKIFGMNF